LLSIFAHKKLFLTNIFYEESQYPLVRYKDFLKSVKTGDVLLTRAPDTVFCNVQKFFLNAIATHASLIIKISDDEIYMYEGATAKGAQLRCLRDYVENSNVDCLYWRQYYGDETKIQNEMLKYVYTSYDWSFIKFVFYEALGTSFMYYLLEMYNGFIKTFKSKVKMFDRNEYNCSSLVAKILTNIKIINPIVNYKYIFPTNLLQDETIRPSGDLSKPLKIIECYNL
jgi:hypothetical protein